MTILLSTPTMIAYCEQSLYVYEVGTRLPFEHDITVVSQWGNNKMLHGLTKAGVKCLNNEQIKYDNFDLILAFASLPENIDQAVIVDCRRFIQVKKETVEEIEKDFTKALEKFNNKYKVESIASEILSLKEVQNIYG